MTPISLDQLIDKQTTSNKPSHLIPFGEYLFKRLEQIHKVHSIFGVPGDFNLPLLEHLYKSNLQWIGGCNELNSGYSADGYSRYTKSIGVLITTLGVGELSAINAISGAFAEYSKVLHIVGLPSTEHLYDERKSKRHLHHLVPDIDSLEKSDFLVYTKMVSKISCISKTILDESTLLDDLDEVILKIFQKSRPGYLFLPLNFSDVLVDGSRLFTKPAFDYHLIKDTNQELTNQLADEILNKIYQSSNPSILADILVDRYTDGTDLLRTFVDETNFHNYTTFMGKSILDESKPSFVGDYIGKLSNLGVKENIESSDLILFFGPYINEINTGSYSFDFTEESSILFHSDYIKIGSKIHHGVHFIPVLKQIISKLDQSRLPPLTTLPYEISPRYSQVPSPCSLSQSTLLKNFEKFLKPDDVIVCETGSFMFGIPDLKFPTSVKYIFQGFYFSIGAALPISVGVGVAMKETNSNSRLILVEGDGSAQMTYQEISSFPYYNISPIIFLLNNSGYTVERIIKGETRSYNDIKPWNWLKTFELFEFKESKRESKVLAKVIKDEDDLKSQLSKIDEFPNKLRFFEVILDKMDCPWRFHQMNNYKHFPIPLNVD